MFDTKPKYNFCIGKEIEGRKHKFTEVGVAWESENGTIKISSDINFIVTEDTKLFLFLKNKEIK